MDVRLLLLLAVLGIVDAKLISSCEITKKFVNGHTSRRLKLARGQVPGQPAASKMYTMEWDEELATKASKWADLKKYGHNPDKTVPSGKYTTGENLYSFSTTEKNYTFDAETALENWWEEYKDYKYGKLTKETLSAAKDVGHYTQMSWSNSTKLGCAISNYTKNGKNTFYVVCNYGPAGNIIGVAPYKSGTASGKLVCKGSCGSKYGTKC